MSALDTDAPAWGGAGRGGAEEGGAGRWWCGGVRRRPRGRRHPPPRGRSIDGRQRPAPRSLRRARTSSSTARRTRSPRLAAAARCCHAASVASGDARYVQMWLDYADNLARPDDLFKFMKKKKVGLQSAAFWCAWALRSAPRSAATSRPRSSLSGIR